MSVLPLEKRLKKNAHRKLSAAQDILVGTLYEFFPRAVIHDGTAIWRCYGGKRFSEDVDAYLPRKSNREENFRDFISELESAGFLPTKFKHTQNSISSKFEFSGVVLRFEAVFKDLRNFVVKPFETSDGTFMSVYTLESEDLVAEKIDAFSSRAKARDLYDIWFLLNFVEKSKTLGSRLSKFLAEIRKPEDYAVLKTLIIMGPAPSYDDLVGGIRSWVLQNT